MQSSVMISSVDFISALQFLSEQFAVLVGIGDVRSEVIVQLVVGVCPSAILGMLSAFGYHVVGKLPDVVSPRVLASGMNADRLA